MMFITATSASAVAVHFVFPSWSKSQQVSVAVCSSLLLTLLSARNGIRKFRDEKIDRFDDQWRGMREVRKQATTDLSANIGVTASVEDVLDFLEDLGKALADYEVDAETVYQRFNDVVIGYWEICFHLVVEAQQECKEDWENVYGLYDRMRKRAGESPRSPAQLKAFLEREAGR